MRIGELCTREVVYCERTTGVVELAQLMRRHHVGDLIVVDRRDGKLLPVGIVTDRDLTVEVLAQRLDPDSLTAGDLMRRGLVTAKETEQVHDAIERMRTKGVRRLPVVDDQGGLIGVLSVEDVTELLAEELTETTRIGPYGVALEKDGITRARV